MALRTQATGLDSTQRCLLSVTGEAANGSGLLALSSSACGPSAITNSVSNIVKSDQFYGHLVLTTHDPILLKSLFLPLKFLHHTQVPLSPSPVRDQPVWEAGRRDPKLLGLTSRHGDCPAGRMTSP